MHGGYCCIASIVVNNENQPVDCTKMSPDTVSKAPALSRDQGDSLPSTAVQAFCYVLTITWSLVSRLNWT